MQRLVAAILVLIASLTATQLIAPATPHVLALGNCATARTSGTLDSEEQAMLGLINAYRTRDGLAPLTLSLTLDRAALWKSVDMAANGYFSHDDLIRSWMQRFSDCGYPATARSENIAMGNADAAATFEQWRTSPPHNANLLNPSFKAVGIGRSVAAGGSWYWTADFGDTVDASASTAATPAIPAVPTAPVLQLPSQPAATGAHLTPGASAAVSASGDCLRAHAAPSQAATVLTCLPDGMPVVIVGGPIPSEGHVWWQLFGSGWVAGEYLRPT